MSEVCQTGWSFASSQIESKPEIHWVAGTAVYPGGHPMDVLNDSHVCLLVTGADRHAFLQAQLTQDIGLLEAGVMLSAAWCNPKGRVIALLDLCESREAIAIFLPAWQADDFQERLLRYRLRADVQIAADTDLVLRSIAGPAQPAEGPTGEAVLGTRPLPGNDPPVAEVCGRVRDLDRLVAEPARRLDDEDRARAAVRAGRPALHPRTVEGFTPHMLNLDLLGAVSFQKGCYPGQEVVARTENLGRPSRRLFRYGLTTAIPPEPGDRLLSDDGTPAGTVVRAAVHQDTVEFLAVVSIRRIEDALRLEDGSVVRRLPLPYRIPEAETG